MRRYWRVFYYLGGLIGLGMAVMGCSTEDEPEVEIPEAEGIFAAPGQILPGATQAQREAFERGLEVAERQFTPEDGLGPKFNVTACAACHLKPVVGGTAGRYRNFFLVGEKLEDGTFLFGPDDGIVHTYGIEPYAELRPPSDETLNVVAQRSPIPLFGMGLIAEIPEEVILANADPEDSSGNGISGRPNWDRGFVGRFGRKAQTVSIEGFIRGPLFNHMGITTDPLSEELLAQLPVPSDLASRTSALQVHQDLDMIRQGQAAPPSEPLSDADSVPDPELSQQDLFDLVSFTMLLAAPQPSPKGPEARQGEEIFLGIGCADCHIPSLASPRGKIPLYSDLLLHDMGPELADGIEMGVATGSEFRTQPLWGVAIAGPWLHDGRADTLDEAIRWHGGEGQASRDAYLGLSSEQQDQVIAFLESLGGEEFMTEGSILAHEPLPQPGELGGPVEGLSEEERLLWQEGRRLFDADIGLTQGLGNPGFNSDSCRSCHGMPTIGGAGSLDVSVIRGGYWEAEGYFAVPEDGVIFDRLTIPGKVRREVQGHGITFERRASPHLFGLGMIESISDEAIEAGADPEDLRGDGIRGRVSYLEDGRIGRFGWKADIPTIREFVRDAVSNEMGMTVPQEEGMSFGDPALAGESPQASPELIDGIEFFLTRLGPPPRSEQHERGEVVFDEVGCTGCHMPELPGSMGPVPLYSDLLLHDISAPDHVGVPVSHATAREFRTPPLWGVRHNAPYLHDGSASTIEAAIEAHHGTAESARREFEQLSETDQAALLDFLKGL